jgi:hypothetical protein
VLGCIGEQFEEGDEVCGVTVNIRNGKNRIELWTKTAANEALQVGRPRSLSREGLPRIARHGHGPVPVALAACKLPGRQAGRPFFAAVALQGLATPMRRPAAEPSTVRLLPASPPCLEQ